MTEFARIFNPKADRAAKAIAMLTNGHRYEPTQEEKDRILLVLKDAVNDIASLYGMLPKVDTTTIAPEIAMANAQESLVEASRVDAKVAALAKGDWPFLAIDQRVRSIPENQLSSYVTQIMHRMCEKFDTTEG